MNIIELLFWFRRDQREARQEARESRREQRESLRDLLELADRGVQAYESLLTAECDDARRANLQEELTRRLLLRASVIDRVLGSHPALPSADVLQEQQEVSSPPWRRLVAVAQSLVEQGQDASAVDVLDLAEELHQTSSAAIVRYRAQALEHMGRLDEALAEFDRVESPPNSRRLAQLDKARMLGTNDRAGEARSIAEPLLAQDEDDAALVTMATISAWEGQTSRALEFMDRAVFLRPDDAGLLSIELHFAEMGESQQIEQIAKQLLELEADHCHGLAAMARMYLRKGEPERALECARKVLQRQPECVQAHVLLAEALQRLNRYDDAIAEIGAAERIDPGNPELPFMRATAILRKPPEEYESYQHQYRATMSALSATIEHLLAPNALRAHALVVRGLMGLVFDAFEAAKSDFHEAQEIGVPKNVEEIVIRGLQNMTEIVRQATGKQPRRDD